jgi:hypothetical protein
MRRHGIALLSVPLWALTNLHKGILAELGQAENNYTSDIQK